MIGTRPLRILVVDDDPAMVGAITALVGTEGHQVITAYDGLTAVKRFREERPDLVLLDLAMPGPDGFTVIGQLRASGNVPVLVVSGESAEAAKVKALGIGADDYLVKPFGKQELLARISAVMRRVDLADRGVRWPQYLAGTRDHTGELVDSVFATTPVAQVPAAALLRPGHPQLLAAGYPAPMVDLKAARERVLQAFRGLNASAPAEPPP